MRTTWVIGNWKMNGSLASNAELLRQLSPQASESCKMAVCVPYPYLAQVAAMLPSGVTLAAQNMSQFASGAYTGEISGQMLQELGVEMVVLGHSERRQMFAESDEIVGLKVKSALDVGLTPIVCVGETAQERDAGLARSVVLRQLSAVLPVVGQKAMRNCILAYEPVWAIGTGAVASIEQIQEVHGWLRAALRQESAELADNMSVLYGGSVKPSNAAEIFKTDGVDGGLIGGASLVGGDFMAIYQAALQSSGE
ncbi:MAG: triose-phosphate isomerase [Formosimonas sp.]